MRIQDKSHPQTGDDAADEKGRRIAQFERVHAFCKVAFLLHLESRLVLVTPPTVEVWGRAAVVSLVHVSAADAPWTAIHILKVNEGIQIVSSELSTLILCTSIAAF